MSSNPPVAKIQTFYPKIAPTIPYDVQRHLQLIYQKLNNHALAMGRISTDIKAGSKTTNITVQGGGGSTPVTIPIATAVSLGIVKPDNTTITVDSTGTLSATGGTPPLATPTSPGIVQPDDVTITVDGSGIITAVTATTSAIGMVKPDNVTLTVDGTGTMSVVPVVTALGITIDGGTSTPTTGSKGYLRVPFACTITYWQLLADQSGSAQITVKKGTYAAFPTTASIVASAPPNLSSAQKNQSSTLTGWTTAITAGDILEFNLDSVTTCQRLTLQLQVTRS